MDIISTDLQQFQLFVAARVAAGDTVLPEECLLDWRNEHPLPSELEQSAVALRASIDDMTSGRMRDFDAVNSEIRQRHGWATE